MISKLYSPPDAPPARLWDAVQRAEKSEDRAMLAVPPSHCGTSSPLFAIQDFLRAQIGAQSVVNGCKRMGTHPYHHVSPLVIQSFPRAMATNGNGSATQSDGSAYRVDVQNSRLDFSYAKTDFRLYSFTYCLVGNTEIQQLYILTWKPDSEGNESLKSGQRLVADVYAWSARLRDDEMWLYNGLQGGWRKDTGLYHAVHEAEADDLICSPEWLAFFLRDTAAFFESKKLFTSLNIHWRRGILLLGPPGNGKTSIIKVLARNCAVVLEVPTLFVQTMHAPPGVEQHGIVDVLQKARQQAPCVLVLEDVDDDMMHTALLHGLDDDAGVASNEGVMTIVTSSNTTQVEWQRSSRFDAVYNVALPDDVLRERFIRHWIAKTSRDTSTKTTGSDEAVDALVQQTKLFSFAQIKQLFMSFLLRQVTRDNTCVCAKQLLAHLSTQQRNAEEQVETEDEEEEEEQSSEDEEDGEDEDVVKQTEPAMLRKVFSYGHVL